MNKDTLPKFIHFVFGLGVGSLVFFYVKERFGKTWGLLGMFVFITSPIVIALSTAAYVDLGLAFFTTLSVLSFVRWKDAGYGHPKWLIISALSMGMALGTKYIALASWLFLNLMVALYCLRDTGKKLPAVRHTLTFLLISLAIASPWYAKNYVLTSNPVYPFFEEIFNPHHHTVIQSHGMGTYGTHVVPYEDDLWESLSRPIGVFLRGKYHSGQYFRSILNPIVLVIIPFAFLMRGARRDAVFFLSFSVFFLVALPLVSAPTVRYILPVIPFLVILSVMAIRNVMEWTKSHPSRLASIGLLGMLLTVLILIGCNILYLKDHFTAVRPVACILGKETKHAFLARSIPSYPALHYINERLPADARVLLVFVAGRGYYLDRPYCHDPYIGKTVDEMVRTAQGEPEFISYLQSLNCSHMLTNTYVFKRYLESHFEQQPIGRLLDLMDRHCSRVFESKRHAVYKIGA